jgi:hypothetical protein
MDPHSYHVGNLDHHLGDWLIQSVPDHGATHAQVGVINDYLADSGHTVSAEDGHYLAAANGWFHPTDSTGVQDAGHLLEAYGIPHHRVESGSIDQVLGELKEGHRVIVGLRDEHLAVSNPLQDFLHSFQERLGIDHSAAPASHQAVAIKGIDNSDPEHPKVLLYDPKDAKGATVSYPLEAFSHAWAGSDFSFVATNSAPGATSHEHSVLGDLVGQAAGLLTAGLIMTNTGHPGMAIAGGKFAEQVTDKLAEGAGEMWDSIMKSL